MDQNTHIEQAAAHFRPLLTEQLNRQERMAQGSPAKDFSRMERIVIGLIPGDGIGPILMAQARRVLEKLLAGAERSGAELVLCNCRPVTEDGAEHPLPADEQFAKETVLDVNAFWDAFNTPWINQFTGTAHRLYAAKLFDGVRYPLGMLHEDYYVLPDLIARCTKILCLPFTGYYVLRHAGSITDGAKHEVRLAMTKGDIHRAEYFLQNGWYDRAEGALTDAALFLYKNKRGYDLTRPGHKAEFAAVKRELCRVYSALAAQKGAASLKLRAAALRMGLPVFYAYTKILSRR